MRKLSTVLFAVLLLAGAQIALAASPTNYFQLNTSDPTDGGGCPHSLGAFSCGSEFIIATPSNPANCVSGQELKDRYDVCKAHVVNGKSQDLRCNFDCVWRNGDPWPDADSKSCAYISRNFKTVNNFASQQPATCSSCSSGYTDVEVQCVAEVKTVSTGVGNYSIFDNFAAAGQKLKNVLWGEDPDGIRYDGGDVIIGSPGNARSLRLVPGITPGLTCDGSNEGAIYYKLDDDPNEKGIYICSEQGVGNYEWRDFHGPAPTHEWSGTQLRFENPDGSMGAYTDLRGLKGDKPAHNWSGTQLRFENPDGSMGSYVNLQGPPGDSDNMGDHSATQNIKTNGYWISKYGANEGIFVDTSAGQGRIGINDSSPNVELDINGRLRASYNEDRYAVLGRAAIGGFNQSGADTAMFSHIDQDASDEIALMQLYNGWVRLNAPSGQTIAFTIGSSEQMEISSSAVDIDKDLFVGDDIETQNLRVSSQICIGADCRSSWPGNYQIGNGLELNGETLQVDYDNAQVRVSGSCPSGQSIRAIYSDGNVACETDDVGTSSPWLVNSSNVYRTSGRVGIGTSSPVDTLHVNGGIWSKSIYLQNGVAAADVAAVGDVTAINNMYVGGRIYHEGDTNTYIGFQPDRFDVVTGGNTALVAFSDGDINLQKNVSIGGYLNVNGHVAGDSLATYGEILALDSNGFWFKENNGSNLMYIKDNGNVGIGTSSPAERLHVNGTVRASTFQDADNTSYYADLSSGGTSINAAGRIYGSIFYDQNSTSYYVDPASTSKLYNLYVGNNIYDNNDSGYFIDLNYISEFRDIRTDMSYTYPSSNALCFRTDSPHTIGKCSSSSQVFKENIENLGLGLDELMQMRPVTFNYKKDYMPEEDTSLKWLGFIAEDLEEIDPILVSYDENGKVVDVKYENLTALLTKAVQEQQVIIDDLSSRIEELERQN